MKCELSIRISIHNDGCGCLSEVKHVEASKITDPVFLQTFLKNSVPLIMP